MKNEMNTAGIGEEELRGILQEWLENPYWAAYYREAPTARCRRFIALEFRFSEYEDDVSAREMDRIEERMDIRELRWLLKHCGRNPRRKQLQDRIAALADS